MVNQEKGVQQETAYYNDLNWGAFAYAAHTPQFRSCNIIPAVTTFHIWQQLWYAFKCIHGLECAVVCTVLP